MATSHFATTTSWATPRRSAATIRQLSNRTMFFFSSPKTISQKSLRGAVRIRDMAQETARPTTPNDSVEFLYGDLPHPFDQQGTRNLSTHCFLKNRIYSRNATVRGARASHFLKKRISFTPTSRKELYTIPRCSGSSNFSTDENKSSSPEKTPFGYTRKDVLLIGVGVTVAGYGLKSGLEYFGVDPLQAGNVVQLVLVLGLTVGWISTYVFRVSNKEMTYAQQLRDYENKVMEKRLESLTEAEIQALLEQVEEEKQRLAGEEQVK